MFGWRQYRRERPAAPRVSAEPECGDRRAMERGAPPDHQVAGAVAPFAVILERHFDRVLRRLGAAGDEPDFAESLGRKLLDDDARARLNGLGREGMRWRKGEAGGLFRKRVDDLRYAVPDRGHCRRSTAAVDVAIALVVVEIDPFAADKRWVGAVQIAMDDACALRVHQAPLSQIV